MRQLNLYGSDVIKPEVDRAYERILNVSDEDLPISARLEKWAKSANPDGDVNEMVNDVSVKIRDIVTCPVEMGYFAGLMMPSRLVNWFENFVRDAEVYGEDDGWGEEELVGTEDQLVTKRIMEKKLVRDNNGDLILDLGKNGEYIIVNYDVTELYFTIRADYLDLESTHLKRFPDNMSINELKFCGSVTDFGRNSKIDRFELPYGYRSFNYVLLEKYKYFDDEVGVHRRFKLCFDLEQYLRDQCNWVGELMIETSEVEMAFAYRCVEAILNSGDGDFECPEEIKSDKVFVAQDQDTVKWTIKKWLTDVQQFRGKVVKKTRKNREGFDPEFKKKMEKLFSDLGWTNLE
jgi:hypothetical protein